MKTRTSMKTIHATDYEEWEEQGLDKIQSEGYMEFRNQRSDYGDSLRGDWFIVDDAKKVIIRGTFGNYNSPGASGYTYADIYDDLTEYELDRDAWDSYPEYIDEEENDNDYSDV